MEGGANIKNVVYCAEKSQYWIVFSTDENSETLESSAKNYGRSMLNMFLTALYMVDDLETETVK